MHNQTHRQTHYPYLFSIPIHFHRRSKNCPCACSASLYMLVILIYKHCGLVVDSTRKLHRWDCTLRDTSENLLRHTSRGAYSHRWSLRVLSVCMCMCAHSLRQLLVDACNHSQSQLGASHHHLHAVSPTIMACLRISWFFFGFTVDHIAPFFT